jgi:phosphinothricin acetyltransferase
MVNVPTIRLAVHDDAAVINEIYNPYALNTTSTFRLEPFTLEERESWLTGRNPEHPVTVAEVDGVGVGWCALTSFRPRGAYSRTAEIGFYIDDRFHRRGIGRALVIDMLARAHAVGLHVIVAACCAETVASIGLLEACGFERAAHFHQVGFKFGRWLDIIFLERMLVS